MAIGDLESAQETYYENIILNKAEKDTANTISSLYSLGQLYSDQGDYEDALKCYLEIIGYVQSGVNLRPTTIALTDFELSEVYFKMKSYDKAMEIVEKGLEYIVKEKIAILESDFLLHKSAIYLAQNKIDSAEYIYKQLIELDKSAQDQHAIGNNQHLLAEIYTAKKKYKNAFVIYQKQYEGTDSSDLELRMSILNSFHELSKKMKDFESAYEYLLTYNEIKRQKELDRKRQKTAYLKVKYDSEQKEKDNSILAAEIVKKKAEHELLYVLITFISLFLLVLLGAFYQKGKYNKRLEAEVSKRTLNLQKSNERLNKSNKELDQFNRILSHDLKEPLRSIVGFSQLAKQEKSLSIKVKEYLAFVEMSGVQLSQLIQDVNTFQKANKIKPKQFSSIDIVDELVDIFNVLRRKYPDKPVTYEFAGTPKITIDSKILAPIFQNILDNAIKFNNQKEILININYTKKDQFHVFEIKDNGIGIDTQYHEKVFEMFKRLHNRKTYNGSGLGLSIAQKLVEKIDGDISVLTSSKTMGTTFSMSFPA